MFKITKTQRIIVSAALVVVSFLLHQWLGYKPVTIGFMLATTVMAGTPIFLRAISALRYKILGIDALVTIAVVGALFIGEYWEAAAVTFLFIFGDYLEARTIEKTRSSLKALMNLAPVTARVQREGEEIEILASEVLPGELVIVKPGEKIPVDGIILEGAAAVNQSAITGESLPVDKEVEENVFSGTVIETGYLVIQALKVGEDTTFARILTMVEDAQDKKAKTQKFLEKFSRFYTPGIIILTILLYAFTRDLELSLTLLVISCPGALVISAPVSIVAGIGNGAKHGVLVKGGDIMEKLGGVKVVAFDKTGTLTQGLPGVTKIKALQELSEKDVLRITAIGESYSEHPLARAIIQEYGKIFGSQTLEKPQEPQMIPGQGLTFSLGGKGYLAGNRKLFRENGHDLQGVEDYLVAEELAGNTTILLGTKDTILGVLSLADKVRPQAKDLVQDLKKMGIRQVFMLTGDNEHTAAAISAQLGLDGFFASLLPQDKVRVVDELQKKYGKVAMVGDGVNDAPALASADLGIALGAAGSDVAMETADVVLMLAEIRKLSYAMGLSRATLRNMKQNIVFALLVAGFLLAGVLFKSVNLSFGMLMHEISVLLVIINAVRLLGYKAPWTNAPNAP